MRKPKLLITRFFPGDADQWLADKFDVCFCRQIEGLEPDELKAKMMGAEAVISMGDEIGEAALSVAPGLRVIADMWGGRGVDKRAAERRGIKIAGSGMPITWINKTEAEHATMMMLALGRGLFRQDAFVRSGDYRNYEQANKLMLGQGLYGRTLGIVGGTHWSGDEMVKRAVALGMNVIYHDQGHGEAMEQLGAVYTGFDELLKVADFVVLMGNGFEGYLFDKPQFDRMNHKAYLVNVTRGSLINEAELARALADGRLAGAGLDKFEHEPATLDALKTLTNVVLSPHSDGAMLRERSGIFRILAEKCAAEF